ncbi:MAG: DUF1450 domain-containing protein [Alicyclobacillaceae bacterium]|nr:DUF1450 domain-containing protein [Alicyclobacillaceae bacterium]
MNGTIQSLSLKFCKRNLERSGEVLQALREKYPDLSIEVADCLEVCGLCTDVPFVLRNNGIVHGRNPRDLYLKLENGMEPLFREDPLPGTAAAKALSGAGRREPDPEP